MELKLYSVYDRAAGAYMTPAFMSADGMALRSFADQAKDASTQIGKHPEDYALFRVGKWNDHTGELEAENPTCIARAHELLARVAGGEGNGTLVVRDDLPEEHVDA